MATDKIREEYHVIDVGAGKVLGLRRIFAQTSPKNTPKKIWPPKQKTTAFHVGQIFSNQSAISPKYSPNLPEKNWIKAWPQKKTRRLHFDFGCHLSEIKAHTAILRRYSHIWPKFP